MSKIIGFNYDGIEDAKVRNLARDNAIAINDMLEKTGRYAVEIGKRLLEIKALMGTSSFHAWRESEIKISTSTACLLTRVAQRFADVECVENFGVRALYMLSRDCVPDEVVEAQIARAQNGEHVTQRDVQEACDAANVRPQERPGLRRINVMIRAKDSASLNRSLDKLREVLSGVAGTMTRDEREALADRVLELALELRRNVPVENGELKPVA